MQVTAGLLQQLTSLTVQSGESTEIPWIPASVKRAESLTELQDDGYEHWLRTHFAGHLGLEFAEHHREFWEWVWSIRPSHGQAGPAAVRDGIPPFVAIWPRFGGKSASAELAVVAVAARDTRRYCLYVSGTQEQANKHVRSIAAMFESVGGAQYAERRLGRYGHSRGWTQGRLRTASGFAVDAIGLDQSIRGTRDEANRPDLIVLDDIDAIRDHDAITQQKLDAITRDILPAGGDNTAVLAIQNLVSSTGVFAQLCSDAPPFLSGRILSGPIPAVRDLVLDGSRIIGGEPTWKTREQCQADIDLYGLEAWLAECQHEVGLRAKEGLVYGADGDGVLRFDPRRNVREAPCLWAQCKWRIVGFDPGGDDPSALVELGIDRHERHHIYGVRRVLGGLDDLAVHEWLAELHKRGPITLVVKDAAGGASSIMTLGRMGWPVQAAAKSRDEIAYIQGLFKSGRLTIDPSCWPDVEREIYSYWWDDRIDRTRGSAVRWATRTASSHHADVLDAIRYACVAVKQGLPGIPSPAGQVGRVNGPRLVRIGDGLPGYRRMSR